VLASRSLWWVFGGSLLLACNAKVAHSPDGNGGNGADSLDGSSDEASGGKATGRAGSGQESACPNCPAAAGVQLCCAEVCGYLNTESGECVPSIAGSQVFSMVTAPEGSLCKARPLCENSDGCPAQIPADGSACAEDRHCNYCAMPGIPRTVRCLAGAWVTIGPNPPCAYVVDPVR
jgi:hypothetical protein